ncbi:nucleotidyl transferase AbiEii/AbiGii toxin family protein [uncultured Chitinophaga sp.]|jgi:Uncharacterized conserved protein|uniref:nucleotidyl transferase AbiEii/AbiGii toxin family protein n=1 Tax=uncultured Chitinophaga sp. TaxID=339340 RepID=UPI00260EDCB2|nr:nucleotidyl transferase AbiEii/AbiGii toxin family protein [uncultured Chitinophaga sp.]
MPDKQLIEDAAAELGISKAFVEKDWHVVQVLQIISSIQTEDLLLTFTGGTSLSKAHKILKRFSEDIDFTVTPRSFMMHHQQIFHASLFQGSHSNFFMAPTALYRRGALPKKQQHGFSKRFGYKLKEGQCNRKT